MAFKRYGTLLVLSLGLMILLFIISGDRFYVKKQSLLVVYDTIKPVQDYSMETNCSGQFDGYFYRFGFYISNYYTICTYEGRGGDTIAIISPKILTPEASACRNESKRTNNGRLLIISGRRKQVLNNVIENSIGAGTCGGEFVEFSSEGFNLYKESGQACNYSYFIRIVLQKEDYYIANIALETYCPNDQIPKRAEFDYLNQELSLKKYNRNIPDSLRKVSGI